MMSAVLVQPIQKSARQRRPERLSQPNTEHVKNLNLIIFKFKTLQSVSPVIGIISGICQK